MGNVHFLVYLVMRTCFKFLNSKWKLKTNSSFPKKTTINSSKEASVEGTSSGYFCHNRMLALLCHYWLCRNRKNFCFHLLQTSKELCESLAMKLLMPLHNQKVEIYEDRCRPTWILTKTVKGSDLTNFLSAF